MCDSHGHLHHHHHSHECDCTGGCECHGCDCERGEGEFQRRYQTKKEQVTELEEYLAELKAETQAVEEQLADLRK